MLPSAKDLEGKRVPNVTFKVRVNDEWKDVSTEDIFKGKTLVVLVNDPPVTKPDGSLDAGIFFKYNIQAQSEA